VARKKCALDLREDKVIMVFKQYNFPRSDATFGSNWSLSTYDDNGDDDSFYSASNNRQRISAFPFKNMSQSKANQQPRTSKNEFLSLQEDDGSMVTAELLSLSHNYSNDCSKDEFMSFDSAMEMSVASPAAFTYPHDGGGDVLSSFPFFVYAPSVEKRVETPPIEVKLTKTHTPSNKTESKQEHNPAESLSAYLTSKNSIGSSRKSSETCSTTPLLEDSTLSPSLAATDASESMRRVSSTETMSHASSRKSRNYDSRKSNRQRTGSSPSEWLSKNSTLPLRTRSTGTSSTFTLHEDSTFANSSLSTTETSDESGGIMTRKRLESSSTRTSTVSQHPASTDLNATTHTEMSRPSTAMSDITCTSLEESSLSSAMCAMEHASQCLERSRQRRSNPDFCINNYSTTRRSLKHTSNSSVVSSTASLPAIASFRRVSKTAPKAVSSGRTYAYERSYSQSASVRNIKNKLRGMESKYYKQKMSRTSEKA